MPALSFSCENKKQAIVNKECSQTIRPPRKNPIEKGDRLYIYWKQRVPKNKKDHHKIGEGITTDTYPLKFIKAGTDMMYVDFFISSETIIDLAQKDGFNTHNDMINWFKNKYGRKLFNIDFKIIRWEWC